MNVRGVLILSIGLVLAACQSSDQSKPDTVAATDRLNVFLLVAEDLSPRVGAYGDNVARTPHIDALAGESILFRNAFTTAPICAPSRSSLITGVHQQALGTMHMRASAFGVMTPEGHPYQAVPPAEIKAFPELLRRHGIYTINDDKTDYQFGAPFTIWDRSSKGAAFDLDVGDQPLFAMVNFSTSHEGYLWPPDDDYDHPLGERTRMRNAAFDADKTVRTDPDIVEIPPYYPQTPGVARNLARHYDNIAATDMKIGAFLDQLKARGLYENSLIIFTTDHGDGLPRAKRTLYDSGLAVPLLVRLPKGRQGGTDRSDLVSFTDLAPTILSTFGVAVPDWTQGRVIIGDEMQPAPDFVFAASHRQGEAPGRSHAVRSKRYKYIRNYTPERPRLPRAEYGEVNPILRIWRSEAAAGRLSPEQAQYFETPGPAVEFYDLDSDPHEMNNLASSLEHAAALAAHDAALEDWLARTPDQGQLDESVLANKMWPDGVQPITAAPHACRTRSGRVALSGKAGASIGYRVNESTNWALYTEPVDADLLIVRAVRYGFADSAEMTLSRSSLERCN